ncbi:uncharacterized protein N0V89_003414 [Didymosphaeria variabile]|uniref:GPI inositol-deacylase winged helix domain-containing protein n=1 Tax=Didymosphaeria variabile TaxID=1932322 RepID=A0A9W8XQ75_9PLEO|nr:uncharacterized protein N0V89_003414 [Didymosphaeria variabile]KAJ4355398.1 hypothetical protein N0V89_003414 [Didymosphaeria variabile]
MYMDALKTYRRARDIEKALQELPPTLDATYERILQSIDQYDRADALSILHWLAFAKEPMTLEELAEAAVARPTQSFQAEDRLLQISDVLRMCHSLVDIQDGPTRPEKNDFVRLTHYSVKEYLTSTRSAEFYISETAAHRYIGASCISYIVFAGEFGEESARYPLFPYAATYWYEHLQVASALDPDNPNLQCDRLKPNNLARNSEIRAPAHDSPLKQSGVHMKDPFLGQLSVTAHLGLRLETWISKPRSDRHIEIRGRGRGTALPIQWIPFCTALEAAACASHLHLVNSFLNCSADCDSPNGNDNMLQHTAQRHGVNACSEQSEITPLQLEHGTHTMPTNLSIIAAQASYLEIMKDLRQHAWRIDFDDALKFAIEHGHELVVLFLLQVGPCYWNSADAHLPIEPGDIGTRILDECMSIAAGHNRQSIVQLLRSCYGDWTQLKGLGYALMAASASGHTELVRWLLSQAQEGPYTISIPAEVMNRSLYNAVEGQHADIEALLIQAGADVNHIISSPDPGSVPDHDTLLKACLEAPWMDSAIVALLLDAGAQLHIDDPDYQEAFIRQCRWGHANVVNILREHGMDIDRQIEVSNVPLADTAVSKNPDHRRPARLKAIEVRLPRNAGSTYLPAYFRHAW